MSKTWSLENVVETARFHPNSFFIPGEDERTTRQPGDSVRLHFVLTDRRSGEPSAERMWVTIEDVRDTSPRYVGVLDSEPAYIRGLWAGTEIVFDPEHIAQTIIKNTDPRWFEAAEQSALVSKQVFEAGQCIRWMYRESADREEDSGWRLFSGTETPDYLNDSSNVQICSVGWLTNFDPTLLPSIRGDVGVAFERSSASEPWVEVKDWEPEDE